MDEDWSEGQGCQKRWCGETVETDKIAGGINNSTHGTPANAKKFDKNNETIRQQTVSHEFRKALAKKMSQAPPRRAPSSMSARLARRS